MNIQLYQLDTSWYTSICIYTSCYQLLPAVSSCFGAAGYSKAPCCSAVGLAESCAARCGRASGSQCLGGKTGILSLCVLSLYCSALWLYPVWSSIIQYHSVQYHIVSSMFTICTKIKSLFRYRIIPVSVLRHDLHNQSFSVARLAGRCNSRTSTGLKELGSGKAGCRLSTLVLQFVMILIQFLLIVFNIFQPLNTSYKSCRSCPCAHSCARNSTGSTWSANDLRF